MAAKFPTSVATDADLSVAVNALATTLNGAHNNSVTTIAVSSTTGFPTAGYVSIENEIISYAGTSGGNSFTGCARGADGTSAASHSSGVAVAHNVVAAHHNSVIAEVEAVETFLDTHLGKSTSTTAVEFGYVHGVTSAIQTQLGAKQATLTAGQLPGTATNDTASAGNVGEYISSTVPQASLVSATNNQYVDLTSIVLTAGDWDLTLQTVVTANGSTTTDLTVGIGTAIGNSATGLSADNNLELAPLGSTVSAFPITVASFRVSMSAGATRYAKFFASFTGGPPKIYGRLSARRMR